MDAEEELADDARYTPEYQELYRQQKEKTELMSADANGKHAMLYAMSWSGPDDKLSEA